MCTCAEGKRKPGPFMSPPVRGAMSDVWPPPVTRYFVRIGPLRRADSFYEHAARDGVPLPPRLFTRNYGDLLVLLYTIVQTIKLHSANAFEASDSLSGCIHHHLVYRGLPSSLHLVAVTHPTDRAATFFPVWPCSWGRDYRKKWAPFETYYRVPRHLPLRDAWEPLIESGEL